MKSQIFVMWKQMNKLNGFTFFVLAMLSFQHVNPIFGQEVPITDYTINAKGQVQLSVNSSPQHYYILKIRHNLTDTFEVSTSMKMGSQGNTTILTEALSAYPEDHYQVLEYTIREPHDQDGDGVDDITEYNDIPIQNPINAAQPLDPNDGSITVDNFSTFNQLAITKEYIQWSEFLNGKGFAKFIIVDFNSENPKLYFINSSQYDLHVDFAKEIEIDYIGDNIKKGQIIYHPTSISNNGSLGTFTFNYSNGKGQDFGVVQKCHELLAASMLFLENNLSYFITTNNKAQYEDEITLYQNSRIPILFEEDLFAEVDYWGLNQTEGYGFFRQVSLDQIPGPKDIVLYESLPNTLPRVGGIITSIIQTPLSHVNLRAIQNGIPNAFIREPLAIDSISDLLDEYIYFKVEQDKYTIRKADLAEVNAWYEDLRPDKEQIPPLNLTRTDILPLENISFTMFDSFGAKCANVATMRTFGFPEGTIPNGFGVPFYFYQEFMKYNGFFEEAKTMIKTPNFSSDRELRNEMLAEFRKIIKAAEMPNWMLDELSVMHNSFPEGTSIRCRSSTNNEDLPGFNGAGLYDSKTQHPDEGHISKSIKQVYASLWNLRAYEERDFYRVSHFITSMGVLCHPNYSDEKANGVGISLDPLYQTDNTFYLNSQIGEELITNPSSNAIPEEIILNRNGEGDNNYIIVQKSNLAPNNTIIMGELYLDQMRDYLTVIHDEFEQLYNAVGQEQFAMDIEYKITSEDQLIIKQARPWVSFINSEVDPPIDNEQKVLRLFPNPASNIVNIHCKDCNLSTIQITNNTGQHIYQKSIDDTLILPTEINVQGLPFGIYIIHGISMETERIYTKKFVKY